MQKTILKKPMLNKFYNIESKQLEIGIDEAGRGPMFGRVYSAGVILPKNDEFKYELLKDSKKFTSEKKINEVADYIKANSIAWSIAYEDEKSIDLINIRNATHNAMHKVIADITKKLELSNLKKPVNELYYLLVDGNDFKAYTYLNSDNSMIEQINHILIESGDNKYCSIAAASILAKVERDKYIKNMCEKYKKLDEYYSLEKNKGYGTGKHMEGIKKYGISPWHRTTYGCCRTATINNKEFYL
jgi:ribonuclease HII